MTDLQTRVALVVMDDSPSLREAPAGHPSAPTAADSPRRSGASRAPAILAVALLSVMVSLSVWFLTQPQPLIIQGEADATRIDIASRVDGRVAERPVERGVDVTAGQLLFRIDNPELLTKLAEAQAGVRVAQAQLANIEIGTRAEIVAQKKAAVESAAANMTLAQRTYDRIKTLTASGFAPMQKLDELTNSLQVAQRAHDQAKLAYEEAVNGATKEERGIAKAALLKASASVEAIQSQVDELVVKAPVASQVYRIGAENGEYVSPGVPLLSLVDVHDVWLRFDLREDLIKTLKIGDPIRLRAPALGDKPITATVKVIAGRGEYSGWRATRATGDFDLRTFEVRAYPIEPVPELRPGMSVYAEWARAKS
jgi:HlyD family secretion protein